MGKTLTLDPVTRLEGHISIKVERDDQNGRITAAQSSGTLFRGFEILLHGKDPRDAIHITQQDLNSRSQVELEGSLGSD